jgi:tRNA A37 methylthiotransferase MiaB
LFVGKTVSVLFDRFDKGFAEGNSKEMKRVRVKGDASLLGSIREVEIFKSDTWMLWGRLV